MLWPLFRNAKRSEAIEDGGPDLDLGNLPIGVSR